MVQRPIAAVHTKPGILDRRRNERIAFRANFGEIQ